jgi:hypothetical protein
VSDTILDAVFVPTIFVPPPKRGQTPVDIFVEKKPPPPLFFQKKGLHIFSKQGTIYLFQKRNQKKGYGHYDTGIYDADIYDADSGFSGLLFSLSDGMCPASTPPPPADFKFLVYNKINEPAKRGAFSSHARRGVRHLWCLTPRRRDFIIKEKTT